MGNYRVFANNQECIDSSEQIKKKSSIAIMKYANQKPPQKGDKNFTIDPTTKRFLTFHEYKIYMNLVRIYQTFNKKCNQCCYSPEGLKNGLTSFVHYQELVQHVLKCKDSVCKCYCRLTKTDQCFIDSLYPYGHYMNNKLGQKYAFPAQIYAKDCEDQLICPKIICCRCSDLEHCKCCDFKVVFPSQCKTMHYTSNSNPECKNPEPICPKQKHMDAYAIFPREKQPNCHEEKKIEYDSGIQGCSASARMERNKYRHAIINNTKRCCGKPSYYYGKKIYCCGVENKNNIYTAKKTCFVKNDPNNPTSNTGLPYYNSPPICDPVAPKFPRPTYSSFYSKKNTSYSQGYSNNFKYSTEYLNKPKGGCGCN